jgi:hypothetical protein
MKEFIKTAINEAFDGCSPLDVIKRIVGMIIAMFFLLVCCGADSLGPGRVALCLGICVLLWRFLGISKAFPEE